MLTRTVIHLDSHEWKVVSKHKIFCVRFSSHLSWEAHVNYMSKIFSSITGVLSLCRFSFSQKLKINTYNDLARI